MSDASIFVNRRTSGLTMETPVSQTSSEELGRNLVTLEMSFVCKHFVQFLIFRCWTSVFGDLSSRWGCSALRTKNRSVIKASQMLCSLVLCSLLKHTVLCEVWCTFHGEHASLFLCFCCVLVWFGLVWFTFLRPSRFPAPDNTLPPPTPHPPTHTHTAPLPSLVTFTLLPHSCHIPFSFSTS